MNKKLFDELVESMTQMGQIVRGERKPARELLQHLSPLPWDHIHLTGTRHCSVLAYLIPGALGTQLPLLGQASPTKHHVVVNPVCAGHIGDRCAGV